MTMTLSMRMEQVAVPMTASIFPKIDAMLEETEYQKSLRYVAKGRRVDRYWSMLDFLFSEMFDMQGPCFEYYEGDGPPLRDILVPSQREWCTEKMAGALRVARAMMGEKRERDWEGMRDEAMK